MLSYPWKLAESLRQLPSHLETLNLTSSEADLSLWSQRPPSETSAMVSPSQPWSVMFPTLKHLSLSGGARWNEEELVHLPSTLEVLKISPMINEGIYNLISDTLILPRGLTVLQLVHGGISNPSKNLPNLPPNLAVLDGFILINPDVRFYDLTEQDYINLYSLLPRSLQKISFQLPEETSPAIVSVLPPSLQEFIYPPHYTDPPSLSVINVLPTHLVGLSLNSSVIDHPTLSLLPKTLKELQCKDIAWDGLFSDYENQIAGLIAEVPLFDLAAHPHTFDVQNPEFVEFSNHLASRKPAAFPPQLALLFCNSIPRLAPYVLPSSITSLRINMKPELPQFDLGVSLLLPSLKSLIHAAAGPFSTPSHATTFFQSIEGSLLRFYSCSTYICLPMGPTALPPRNLRILQLYGATLAASELVYLPPLLEQISISSIMLNEGPNHPQHGAETVFQNLPRSLRILSLSSVCVEHSLLSNYESTPVLTENSFKYLPSNLCQLFFQWSYKRKPSDAVPSGALPSLRYLPLAHLVLNLNSFSSKDIPFLPPDLSTFSVIAAEITITEDDFPLLPPNAKCSFPGSVGKAYDAWYAKFWSAPSETPDPRVVARFTQ